MQDFGVTLSKKETINTSVEGTDVKIQEVNSPTKKDDHAYEEDDVEIECESETTPKVKFQITKK